MNPAKGSRLTTLETDITPDPVSGLVADDDAGPRPVPAQRRLFTLPELAFLIGVPLAWAVLLLFHPMGRGRPSPTPTCKTRSRPGWSST